MRHKWVLFNMWSHWNRLVHIKCSVNVSYHYMVLIRNLRSKPLTLAIPPSSNYGWLPLSWCFLHLTLDSEHGLFCIVKDNSASSSTCKMLMSDSVRELHTEVRDPPLGAEHKNDQHQKQHAAGKPVDMVLQLCCISLRIKISKFPHMY